MAADECAPDLVGSPHDERERGDGGATGLIFGRNVFQRSHDDSLRLVARLKEILAKYPS